MHWTKSIGCLGLALLTTSPALARVGVNATQMTPVGIDSSASCNRSFFRSNLHFDNTIFMVPRVVAGAGPDGKRTFDMIPLPDENKWVLNLRLYFPRSSGELRSYGASTQKRDLDSCNLDQVKYSINSKLSPEVRKDQEVRTIAPIPLASIEVKIPNIADTGRLGVDLKKDGTEEQNVDEIIYYGKSLTVQLKLTQAEKDYFDSQVVRPDGLAAKVLLNYMASHNEAAIVAKVDVSNLKAAFSLAAGGTYVAKANLAGDLETAIASTKITFNAQGAQSESLQKVQNEIMDRILKEVSILQSVDTDKDAKDSKAKAGDGQIEVAMVLRAISNKISGNFVYNSDSVPEVATSQTQIEIKQSGVEDPNIAQVLIRSHYQDPTPGFYVRENQSFTISPARWWIDKLEYNDYITTLNLSDIEDLRLSEKFEDITLPGMNISNLEQPGKPIVAVGKYTYLNNLVTGVGQRGIQGPAEYQWRKIQKLPNLIHGNSTRIDLTSGDGKTSIEKLQDLHVGISFTRIGSRKIYSLDQLLMPNPFFIGTFDEASSQIKITARPGHDLGNIEVRELNGFAVEEQKDEEGNPIPTKGVEYKTEKMDLLIAEEIKLGTILTRSIKKAILDHDDDAITMQKVMLVNISRPEYDRGTAPVETVKTIRATQLEGEH